MTEERMIWMVSAGYESNTKAAYHALCTRVIRFQRKQRARRVAILPAGTTLRRAYAAWVGDAAGAPAMRSGGTCR